MNPEVKEQWVAALRSGEYPQGTDYLHRDGKYCCLGVLCDLAEKAGVVSAEWDHRRRALGVISYGAEEDALSLPAEVREWAGIELASPRAGDDELAELNDQGVPFSEIADIIEQHL